MWQLLKELPTFYKYFQEEICQCLGLQKRECDDDQHEAGCQAVLFIHPSVYPQNLPSPSELVTAMSQGAKASVCLAFPSSLARGASGHLPQCTFNLGHLQHPPSSGTVVPKWGLQSCQAAACELPVPWGHGELSLPGGCLPSAPHRWSLSLGNGWGGRAPSRALPVRSRRRSCA